MDVGGDAVGQRTLDVAGIDVVKIYAVVRTNPNAIVDGVGGASAYKTDVYGIGFVIDPPPQVPRKSRLLPMGVMQLTELWLRPLATV